MLKLNLLILVIALLCISCDKSAQNDALIKSNTIGNGNLYATKTGSYNVLSLKGSWLDMGEQYGSLAGDQLREFYKRIHNDILARGIDSVKQFQMAKETYDSYSQELKDLLKGMSITSGLNFDQQIILDASFYILTVAVLNGHPPAACSGIGVLAPRTENGKVFFGRNWDIDREAMIKYMKYLSVVVFNPEKGNSFANIRPLGQVYVETGFNSKGVFIELNNAEASDSCYFPDRRFTGDVIFEALNNTNNFNETIDHLRKIPAETAYIIQVADSKQAVSIERATFDSRLIKAENGLLVTYNSFVEPYPDSWKNNLLSPPPTTQDPRRDNILKLFQKSEWQENINIYKFLDLMNLEINECGAVHDGTVIQVVIVPEDYELYFRGYKYSDFAKVNLKNLFY